jgi:hypothetical protein
MDVKLHINIILVYQGHRLFPDPLLISKDVNNKLKCPVFC